MLTHKVSACLLLQPGGVAQLYIVSLGVLAPWRSQGTGDGPLVVCDTSDAWPCMDQSAVADLFCKIYLHRMWLRLWPMIGCCRLQAAS